MIVDLFHDKSFVCEKCNTVKPTDGAVLHRDPKLNYCICRECRDKLVKLLDEETLSITKQFLGKV